MGESKPSDPQTGQARPAEQQQEPFCRNILIHRDTIPAAEKRIHTPQQHNPQQRRRKHNPRKPNAPNEYGPRLVSNEAGAGHNISRLQFQSQSQ